MFKCYVQSVGDIQRNGKPLYAAHRALLGVSRNFFEILRRSLMEPQRAENCSAILRRHQKRSF